MRHIMKGEDLDDMKSIFEDVGNSFAETIYLLKEQMREAGIDPEKIGDEKK